MIVKSVTKRNRMGAVWFIAGLMLAAGAVYLGSSYWFSRRAVAPVTNSQFPVSANVQEPKTANANSEAAAPGDPVPANKLLAVPFTPQAPTANWDELHNEACEEADALMAHAYFSGKTESTLTPEYAESEIAKLTDWQKENFGYYLDISTPETAVMISKVYGLKTKVIPFPSADEMRKQIAAGNLVVFSANGRLLGNPNYKQPGPIHHMLLIKGYDQVGFITNDSGTKKGLNYAYSYDTLKAAAADWDHSRDTVDENQKLAIIVSKE